VGRDTKAVHSRVDKEMNDGTWCQILELARRADRNTYATSNALAQHLAVRWTHAQNTSRRACCKRKRVDRLRHGEKIDIIGYKIGDEVAAVPIGVPLEDGSNLPGRS
jgi:hypothetical protein